MPLYARNASIGILRLADLGEHVEAADLGGDQVGVLPAEVDDGDGVVCHVSRSSYPGARSIRVHAGNGARGLQPARLRARRVKRGVRRPSGPDGREDGGVLAFEWAGCAAWPKDGSTESWRSARAISPAGSTRLSPPPEACGGLTSRCWPRSVTGDRTAARAPSSCEGCRASCSPASGANSTRIRPRPPARWSPTSATTSCTAARRRRFSSGSTSAWRACSGPRRMSSSPACPTRPSRGCRPAGSCCSDRCSFRGAGSLLTTRCASAPRWMRGSRRLPRTSGRGVPSG